MARCFFKLYIKEHYSKWNKICIYVNMYIHILYFYKSSGVRNFIFLISCIFCCLFIFKIIYVCKEKGLLKNLNTLKIFHVFKNTVKMVHCSSDIKSACIFTQVDRLSVYWLREWQEYTGGKYWKLKPRRESLRNTYVALVGKEAQWLPKKKSLYLVKLHCLIYDIS